MDHNRDNYVSCPDRLYSHMVSTKPRKYMIDGGDYDDAFETAKCIVSNIDGKLLFCDKDCPEFNFIIKLDIFLIIKVRFHKFSDWICLKQVMSCKNRTCYEMSMAHVRDRLSELKFYQMLAQDFNIVRCCFIIDPQNNCSVYSISESISSCMLWNEKLKKIIPKKIRIDGHDKDNVNIIDFSNSKFCKYKFKEFISKDWTFDYIIIDLSACICLDLKYIKRKTKDVNFDLILKLRRNLNSDDLNLVYKMYKRKNVKFVDVRNNNFYFDPYDDEIKSTKIIYYGEECCDQLPEPYKSTHKDYYENYKIIRSISSA